MDPHSVQVARYILGFSWIYHGLFPKLITVAPLERAMTATIGLSDQASFLLTKVAGVAEVVFGILFVIFYQKKALIFLNILALALLCLFVAVNIPALLIEAFNPVTTNLALIGLSCVLLRAKAA